MTTVGWLTLEEARRGWPDAPSDEAHLTELLEVAHELCVEYQKPPTVDDEHPLPVRFKRAQRLQAKAMWQAERAGTGDQIGEDGRVVRVYPMDRQVKGLLRPDDGTPEIDG